MSATVYHRRSVAAKRILWGAMILIGLGLLVLLYSFKAMAQSARKDVRQLETQVRMEEDKIQLLKAEIVFLERPDRLQALSEQTLGLEPVGYTQQDSLAEIRNIPLREAEERDILERMEPRP